MYFQICIIIWLSIVSTGFGANILIVCPAFAKSIYVFHVALARSLHEAGHKITIVHPFSNDAASQNFTVIDSSLPDQPNESNFIHIDKALEKTDIFSMLLLMRDLSENDCHNTIQQDRIQVI